MKYEVILVFFFNYTGYHEINIYDS